MPGALNQPPGAQVLECGQTRLCGSSVRGMHGRQGLDAPRCRPCWPRRRPLPRSRSRPECRSGRRTPRRPSSVSAVASLQDAWRDGHRGMGLRDGVEAVRIRPALLEHRELQWPRIESKESCPRVDSHRTSDHLPVPLHDCGQGRPDRRSRIAPPMTESLRSRTNAAKRDINTPEVITIASIASFIIWSPLQFKGCSLTKGVLLAGYDPKGTTMELP